MKPAPKSTPTPHARQLDRLRRQVRQLRNQLRRAHGLATLGTLTAMVAHEFNNILTPVINGALLAKGDPGRLTKALARVADGGQRAASICQALLGLSREAPPDPEPTPLRELVEQTVSAMARDPRRDHIELVLNVPADLTASARKAELQQVLLNLLLNARQSVLRRPAPRRIEVRAERSGDQVALRVLDNGVGVPRKNRARIFQPFFTTGADPRGRGGGSGLGLAFCRHTVRSMGGRISFESAEGAGATFTVVLPADAPRVAVPAAAG